jgi:hypothetical protein
MATILISDLTDSRELDAQAMAAVRGGTGTGATDPIALILNSISTFTSFDSANTSNQAAVASNSVGAFNFGVVVQDNTQTQVSDQAGNTLGG